MILGLELFGAAVFGFGTALVAVYFYARRVFRQKMGQLAGQLIGASGEGQNVHG